MKKIYVILTIALFAIEIATIQFALPKYTQIIASTGFLTILFYFILKTEGLTTDSLQKPISKKSEIIDDAPPNEVQLIVLKNMSEITEPLNLIDLSQKVHLEKNQVMQLLHELTKSGFLQKNGNGYSLTDKAKNAIQPSPQKSPTKKNTLVKVPLVTPEVNEPEPEDETNNDNKEESTFEKEWKNLEETAK